MKILIIGDQHFRNELPYAAALPGGRRREWCSVLRVIQEASSQADAVVLMGDNLNNRHNNSTVLSNFVSFINILGDKPVHVLVGNHERYGEKTALDFLKEIKRNNLFIYNKPVTEKEGLAVKLREGIYADFVSYVSPNLLGVKTNEEAERVVMEAIEGVSVPEGVRLGFFHQVVSTVKVSEHFDEVILSNEKLSRLYSHVFTGHIHEPSQWDKITVTGSIFTATVGEKEKYVWFWDDGEVYKIPLPVRGIYKVVWEERDKYSIPQNSIVKCYVTDPRSSREEAEQYVKYFDGGIVIEKFPRKREKAFFESGALDVSIDNLLKLYAKAREISYTELKEGLALISNDVDIRH